MNGPQIGDGQIRVDFLRSQPTTREHGRDAKNMTPLLDSPWLPPDPKRQQHSQPLGFPEVDGLPSDVLCISYPHPVVHIDEQRLHNAMILFGEIENITSFPLRQCSFVEFRSVEEARRAKDGLQGKLFNDPRILITYSTRFHINGPNNFPPPMRPLLPNPEFDKFGKLQNPNPDLLNYKPALSPSVRPVSGTWDSFESNRHLQRESKRSRIDDDRGFGANDLHSPLVNLVKKNRIISSSDISGGVHDYVWRGVIAKGGTPVCRARCIPMGQGIQSEIPEIVNCSARTGLDMLTKHYADAIGFDIIFFLPDSEEDFAPYTEFLRFLGTKNRAGVAKFDNGTTLFLVPPSDFLTKVLNVTGPERLYGVVLKFHHNIPARSSAQSLSPPNLHRLNPREPHPSSHGPPITESFSLTPELIAALSSFLPPKEKSPAPVLSDRIHPHGWQNDHNAPEPFNPHHQAYGNISPTPRGDQSYEMPHQQGSFRSGPSNNYAELEIPNQVQKQLQSALYGGSQSQSQSTSGSDKDEMYKSTLQFAANLLLQVQQKQHAVQPTNQPGPGSANQ